MPIISANIVLCLDVLTEKTTELPSAMKMASVLNIASRDYAHFCSIASVFCSPGDHSPHVMSVRMMTPEGINAGSAPDHAFLYGYRQDPEGYGGYNLTTTFDIDLTLLPHLGWFLVCVYVDGEWVTQAPIMLRR